MRPSFLSTTLLAAAALASLACGNERPVTPAGPPFEQAPVVIISVDTLRADRLPAYGYRGVATPAIDALRRDGILFDNAYSHCPMTLPSHVSILTGLLPYQSNVRNNLGFRLDSTHHDSLPAMLHRVGYDTGAAVSAFVLRGETGLRDIFDFYDDRIGSNSGVSTSEVSRPGSETAAAAESWIEEHAHSPFFFFLHLFEPHSPYEAPEPFRSQVSNPYDAEIAASDAIVGAFLENLKKSGVYDRALIVFLSDHGEGLGDHGESEHGVFLYREAVRVPLIIKLPRSERRGTKVDDPVQLIDIAPTIAAATGAAPLTRLRGTSLLEPIPARRIYSETFLPQIHFGWSGLRSLTSATHQYIDAPRPELFDLRKDPRERKNIAAIDPRIRDQMRAALAPHITPLAPVGPVSEEEAAKLAALGYVGHTRSGTESGPLVDPKDAIADLEALRSASALERRGKLREAASAYESITARNPRFADAWLRLAVLRERSGSDEGALEAYRAAVDAAPLLAGDTALAEGSLLLRIGRLDEAAARAAVAESRHPASAHHLLGRIALARQDLTAAEREAHLAMTDPAQRWPGTVLLARVRVAQGEVAEALTVLDENGAAEAKGVRDLASTRGEILARLKRLPEAVAEFEREISSFPDSVEPYTRLATLLAANGKPGEADRVLERMVRSVPNRRAPLIAAEVWTAVGDLRRAGRWRRRARN